MLEDGDRILNIVGVVLVVALLFAVVVLALNFDPPDSADAPETEWAVERVNDSHVRVTHAGGDPVPTENLRVTVDSLERITDFSDPVTPDENTTVPASEGSLVRIVWNGGRGDRVIMKNERL
jgi:FlaG/FlaF family flagellin (archaellin)